jgi:hypothetical protein
VIAAKEPITIDHFTRYRNSVRRVIDEQRITLYLYRGETERQNPSDSRSVRSQRPTRAFQDSSTHHNTCHGRMNSNSLDATQIKHPIQQKTKSYRAQRQTFFTTVAELGDPFINSLGECIYASFKLTTLSQIYIDLTGTYHTRIPCTLSFGDNSL